jgi:hypothetical protein
MREDLPFDYRAFVERLVDAVGGVNLALIRNKSGVTPPPAGYPRFVGF